jgi:hypothetical protein
MSFALEYRKKHLLAPKTVEAPQPTTAKAPKRRVRKAPAKKVIAAQREDTRANRATVLGALLLAAAILAVFNSEGLRLAAGDLAEREAGGPVLAVSEVWDDAMDMIGAKTVMASVRQVVTEARRASWQDVAAFIDGQSSPRQAIAADASQGGDITGSLPRRNKHAIEFTE